MTGLLTMIFRYGFARGAINSAIDQLREGNVATAARTLEAARTALDKFEKDDAAKLKGERV